MEEEKMNGEEENMIPCAEMAESLTGGSTVSAINSKSKGSNTNRRSVCSSSIKITNTGAIMGKSCKGYLYYSSNFQANSRNPLCVGLSRSLPNVPQYIAGDSDIQTYAEGKSLVDFRYGCVGYSLYKDQKGQTSDGQQAQTELPICAGIELLVDQRVKAADSASVTSHVVNKQDAKKLPQNQSPKPTNATEQEFLSRFARNANMVANGVAKNMRRVGNQVKQIINDIMVPYRGPPK